MTNLMEFFGEYFGVIISTFGAALAVATMLVILIAVILLRQADRRWGSRV